MGSQLGGVLLMIQLPLYPSVQYPQLSRHEFWQAELHCRALLVPVFAELQRQFCTLTVVGQRITCITLLQMKKTRETKLFPQKSPCAMNKRDYRCIQILQYLVVLQNAALNG